MFRIQTFGRHKFDILCHQRFSSYCRCSLADYREKYNQMIGLLMYIFDDGVNFRGCVLVGSSKKLLIAEDLCVDSGVCVLLNVDVEGRDFGVSDRFAL